MGPPPKPKKQPDDLAEVERALSVLQGRHPEHERARREDEAARAKRKQEIEKKAGVEQAAASKRKVTTALIAIVVVAVLAVVAFFVFREMQRRGRVDQAVAPWKASGFTLVDTASRGSPGTIDADLDAACFVAVTTSSDPVKVTRPTAGASFEGPAPAIFCTCEPEHVNIASKPDASGGMALLRIDTSQVGGSRAIPFASFKVATSSPGDNACAENSLDAWLDAHKFPQNKVDDAWLDKAPKRKALSPASFHVLAQGTLGTAFTAFDFPKESCVLVVGDANAKLSLRVHGGQKPIANASGPIGWCAQKEGVLVVSSEGGSDITVLGAPASSVGGIVGLRELAREAGIPLVAAVVPEGDYEWNATQILLASAVPAPIITTSGVDVAADPNARVIAVSFGTDGALRAETADDIYSYCEPPLDEKARDVFCIFSGAQTWRVNGSSVQGGLARSKLPFWLFTMQGVGDPVALKAETLLFRLARRLKREGFEPTTIEAVTETPAGADVLGRSGEDAIVAVATAPVAPWVFPLSDGPAWTLDGAPRIMPIKPLEKFILTSSEKHLPPKETRRTIVFRRQQKKK